MNLTEVCFIKIFKLGLKFYSESCLLQNKVRKYA